MSYVLPKKNGFSRKILPTLEVDWDVVHFRQPDEPVQLLFMRREMGGGMIYTLFFTRTRGSSELIETVNSTGY